MSEIIVNEYSRILRRHLQETNLSSAINNLLVTTYQSQCLNVIVIILLLLPINHGIAPNETIVLESNSTISTSSQDNVTKIEFIQSKKNDSISENAEQQNVENASSNSSELVDHTDIEKQLESILSNKFVTVDGDILKNDKKRKQIVKRKKLDDRDIDRKAVLSKPRLKNTEYSLKKIRNKLKLSAPLDLFKSKQISRNSTAKNNAKKKKKQPKLENIENNKLWLDSSIAEDIINMNTNLPELYQNPIVSFNHLPIQPDPFLQNHNGLTQISNIVRHPNQVTLIADPIAYHLNNNNLDLQKLILKMKPEVESTNDYKKSAHSSNAPTPIEPSLETNRTNEATILPTIQSQLKPVNEVQTNIDEPKQSQSVENIAQTNFDDSINSYNTSNSSDHQHSYKLSTIPSNKDYTDKDGQVGDLGGRESLRSVRDLKSASNAALLRTVIRDAAAAWSVANQNQLATTVEHDGPLIATIDFSRLARPTQVPIQTSPDQEPEEEDEVNEEVTSFYSSEGASDAVNTKLPPTNHDYMLTDGSNDERENLKHTYRDSLKHPFQEIARYERQSTRLYDDNRRDLRRESNHPYHKSHYSEYGYQRHRQTEPFDLGLPDMSTQDYSSSPAEEQQDFRYQRAGHYDSQSKFPPSIHERNNNNYPDSINALKKQLNSNYNIDQSNTNHQQPFQQQLQQQQLQDSNTGKQIELLIKEVAALRKMNRPVLNSREESHTDVTDNDLINDSSEDDEQIRTLRRKLLKRLNCRSRKRRHKSNSVDELKVPLHALLIAALEHRSDDLGQSSTVRHFSHQTNRSLLYNDLGGFDKEDSVR